MLREPTDHRFPIKRKLIGKASQKLQSGKLTFLSVTSLVFSASGFSLCFYHLCFCSMGTTGDLSKCLHLNNTGGRGAFNFLVL